MSAAEQKVSAAEQETDVMRLEMQKNMKLTQILLDAERYEDLRYVTQDEEYRKKMLKEFEIE